MARFPKDIFTEPEPDPDTLANLGPLSGMAGIWEGRKGSDDHPVAEGTETDAYLERYALQPIDPQTNGPQLLYGLRYHVHIVKPGEVETFHDQVAMASGRARVGARKFTVRSRRGSTVNGICSNPFLEHAYRTLEWSITVTLDGPRTFSYEQETVLRVRGRRKPFRHTDRNTLHRVAPPTPNPTAPRKR